MAALCLSACRRGLPPVSVERLILTRPTRFRLAHDAPDRSPSIEGCRRHWQLHLMNRGSRHAPSPALPLTAGRQAGRLRSVPRQLSLCAPKPSIQHPTKDKVDGSQSASPRASDFSALTLLAGVSLPQALRGVQGCGPPRECCETGSLIHQGGREPAFSIIFRDTFILPSSAATGPAKALCPRKKVERHLAARSARCSTPGGPGCCRARWAA